MTRGLHSAGTCHRTVLHAWLVILGIVLFGPIPGVVAAHQELRIAFTATAFSGVNRADAEAAFKVFVRTMGAKRGWDVEVEVRMIGDPAALDAGAAHLLVLDAWTYLASSTEPAFEPVFVSSESGKATKQLLLLTHRGSGLDTIQLLRDQTLVVQSASNATLGRRWLETICADHGLGAPDDFFGSIGLSSKPSQAVLPVFFRKKAACLVDSAAYTTLTELNPQVGRALQVVASSEPMVDSVVCLSREGWASAQFRANVIDALAELHLEAAGQQILTLFRSGPLLPYKDDDLRTVRTLRARADALAGGRSPGASDTASRSTAPTLLR